MKQRPYLQALLLFIPSACCVSFVPLAISSQCGYMRCESLVGAGFEGDVGLASSLLENGVPPDCRIDEGGYTSLMSSSWNGHLEVVQLLISRGADHSLKSDDGETALMLAAGSGHYDVVEFLIAEGADLSIQSEVGLTAYQLAKRNPSPSGQRAASVIAFYSAKKSAPKK